MKRRDSGKNRVMAGYLLALGAVGFFFLPKLVWTYSWMLPYLGIIAAFLLQIVLQGLSFLLFALSLYFCISTLKDQWDKCYSIMVIVMDSAFLLFFAGWGLWMLMAQISKTAPLFSWLDGIYQTVFLWFVSVPDLPR